MTLKDLRIIIDERPRQRNGKLVLTDEIRRQILAAFASSGLKQDSFCREIGLSANTLSGIRARFGISDPKLGKVAAFSPIRLTPEESPTPWRVCGPKGLFVECKSIKEVADIWRQLC